MRAYSYILILLILSFCGRIALTIHYSDLFSDKVRHIIAAKNISEGNGYAVSFQNAEDFTETIYTPVLGWPPGYSILVGAVQKVVGDYWNAAVALDLLSIVIFYLSIYLFVYWYRSYLDKRATALTLIFLGVSLAPFGQLSSTDLLSISFFMLATVFLFKWLDSSTEHFNKLIIAGFFVSALIPPFVRYGYYPVVFIFPIFLGGLFLLTKNRRYLYRSLLLFAVFGAFIALYTYYQYTLTGVTPATTLPERHKDSGPPTLYFENLKHFNAFMFNGLLSDFFIINRLSGILALLYNAIKLLITFSFFFLIVNVCVKEIRSKKIDKVNLLILVIFMVNVAFLILLSVKNKMDCTQNDIGEIVYIWTYVIELRYFAPSYFLGFVFIFYNYGRLPRIGSLFINGVIAPLVIISIVYSTYTLASGNKTGTYEYTHKEFLAIDKVLKKESSENKLVLVNGWGVSSVNNAYSSLIQLDGYKVYSVNDVNLSDSTASWYWNNTQHMEEYDTVYYIGDAEKLTSQIADSNLNLQATAAPNLYYLNRTKL